LKGSFQVAHVTAWLSPRGGGIPPVINGLVSASIQAGIGCVVAGLRDNVREPDNFAARVETITGAVVGPAAFGFSPELQRRFADRASRCSLIHSHGLWTHPGIIARRTAARARLPLVVSPHGMLEPWALRNSAWKKRVAAAFFEKRNLRRAACLHALCNAEVSSFRGYGLKNPVAVIPNGVELPAETELFQHALLAQTIPGTKGRRIALFLSRIHEKKGLPHLLRAWRTGRDSFAAGTEWALVIAGPDERGHEREVRKLASELGISSSVVFAGPLYGAAKHAALAGADLFVLPSFSEGFSMAILEAAAYSLPVMLTSGCNFPELARTSAGLEVSADEKGCEAGLRQLLLLSDVERREMGARGRRLVAECYSWPVMAKEMLRVYSWLRGESERPECVRM
jgi:glycosyltransferase involved in cell wall biosynthesis